ncbi:MAG TPA: DUF4097 family beta strand repeat-containing protein [Candidatus Eisenbacteria bacterium]|jgi:hypothetical protein
MMLIHTASLVLAAWTGGGTVVTTERAADRTDTTFTVKAGARLDVENFAGEIAVRTWAKDAVRIEANHSRRVDVEVAVEDDRIKVEAHGRHGIPASVDYRLTVPVWIALDLSGVSTEISVDGVQGELKAQTVHGDVRVRGGGRFVSLGSVDGEVDLSGAHGRIEVSSVNQGVRVADVTGELSAESVNGDIVLERVGSKSLEISTVNGDLYYDGDLEPGGVYGFSTHNGDIVIGLPEKPDVVVSVSTFSGDFSSSIPVQLHARRGKEFSFTFGAGGARLELETFQGGIRLERRGEAAKRRQQKDKLKRDEKTHSHDSDKEGDEEGDEDR